MESSGLCEFLYISWDWCHTIVRFGAIGVAVLILLVVFALFIMLLNQLNP